jgi:adenylate kinase
VAKYSFNHLSTGDLLRAEVASGSPKGKELLEIMTKGGLVSNKIVLELLGAAMANIQNPTGFLIDGWVYLINVMKIELDNFFPNYFRYPREEAQGREFEQTISPVDLILYFDCSNETLVKFFLPSSISLEL